MNYESALEYIHAVQWAGHKPGLSRTRTLLAALGDPHKRLRFVHVAGTNGKGSTAAMLASCLQAAGYRVGLYTSPFINRFNERIQVNGEQIPDDALVRLVERVRPAADAMTDVPTEFEIITALGMLWFAEEKCDIVVLEVGLGGTLDSTNVIDPPECAVITALGMDHVKELGPTIADIAAAKAGIIKPGVPVFYDRSDARAAAVIESQARRLKSPAFGVGEEASWQQTLEHGRLFLREGEKTLEIPFAAPYQVVNAMLAVRTAGYLGISWQAVSEGVRKTVWPGRMEEIAPGVYLDGAHNEGGIRAFARAASQIPGKRKILLFAAASDKEYPTMLRLLFETLRPDAAVLTRIAGSRGLEVETLRAAAEKEAREAGLSVPMTVRPTAEEALLAALQDKGKDDTVFCAGSLYLAGEIEDVIRRNRYDKRR